MNYARPLVLDLGLSLYRLVDRPFSKAYHLVEETSEYLKWKRRSQSFEQFFKNMRHLQNENMNLRQENDNLRRQLNFSGGLPEKALSASVFGYHTLGHTDVLFLRAGTKQGVSKKDILMAESTVAGVIFDVGLNYARAYALSSPHCRIPVYFSNKSLEGIICGQGSRQELILKFVPEIQNVRLGDRLYTSGAGGTYPRDIYIGKISRIDGNRLFVKPVLDLGRVNYVWVHTSDGKQIEQDQSQDG